MSESDRRPKPSRNNPPAEAKGLWLRDDFFDGIQEIAHFGFCEWDYDHGRIISCTPAYARIFGMSVAEVVESQSTWEKVLEQIHPADRDRYRDSHDNRLVEGSHEIEYRVFRRDGEIRHLKEVAIVIQADRERRREALGLVQDVTESFDLRKELEESAAKLRLAARTARLGYWHFDEVAGEYLDISDEYAEIYGYTVPEFLERYRRLEDDLTVVHPDDREALEKAYRDSYGKVDYEYRMRHRDGRWIYVREISIDIKDEAGNYVESLGTLQDVTELKEAQLKAEQANRAKTEFLSRMSHELRTPLNAILGYAQLMQTGLGDDAQQHKRAAAIFGAGQHLLDLINDILDLSRLEAGNIQVEMAPVRLGDAIGESVSLVTEMAETRGITIQRNLGDCRGVTVLADATRLRQVFVNLLSNAVKYNRDRGRIEISAELDAAGSVRVAIRDTGAGIDPERLQELFQPFNRLGAEAGATEGTGIGLVITKQLVELMGGMIEVSSRPGSGSTFTVRLQSVEAGRANDYRPDIPLEAADSGLAAASVNRPRILVAEDNEVNRELIEEQLDCLGYRADYAPTGVEAFELWRGGDYPLLLTDLRMPEMDGYELIHRIRALERGGRRRPLIAVTASMMENDIQRCLDAGADDVIGKPLTLDGLERVLGKWLPLEAIGEMPAVGNTPPDAAAPAEAIDLKLLRQSVGERIEIQRKLLRTYAESLPKALYDLRQAYAWHNLEQLADYAHKLKSSSASLGATRLTQLCRALEIACHDSRETEVAASMSQLQAAADAVVHFVDSFTGESGGPEADASGSRGERAQPAARETSVLLVDDDPVMHRVTTLVLNDLGIDDVTSAGSARQALVEIAGRRQTHDIVICDLNMPEMDGIELTRHLAERSYPGALVLMSGEDARILQSVERFAIDHGLRVLGILEKPVTRAKVSRLLAVLDGEVTDLGQQRVDT